MLSWRMQSPCRKALATRTLNVPRPNGTLYLKLRDDPSVVNTAVLPVTPEPSQSAAVTPLASPAVARPARS